MIKWDTTQTPVIVFIESERSTTIAKLLVKKDDGTTKEYIIRITKDGKALMN